MKLKSLNVTEKRGEIVDIQIVNLTLNDFNLLISDNAQGKTRMFRILNYVKTLVSGKPRLIATHFHGEFVFQNSERIDVLYILDIVPEEGKNKYEEKVIKGGTTIFSTSDKILINEKTNEKVESIFLPKNIPAISSIAEEDFPTLTQINQFFSRIIYIASNKTREITFLSDSIIPDEDGNNISSVLLNWSKLFPAVFNDVMIDFKSCFDFIEEIKFTENKLGNLNTTLLSLKEKGIDRLILQPDWSDGMFRTLHLLMLSRIPFKKGDQINPPSAILVDEIENGLDYKTLKFIVNHFKDFQDESQIIISSHSPLVCDFIHPKYWHIAKRNGSIIHYLSPTDIETDLSDQLDTFKQKHWDFYSKHISNSGLYIVK